MKNDILSLFDTEKASESGAWLHLKLPTGELAYLDGDAKKKPLRIRLKGPDSPEWQAYIRKARTNTEEMDPETESKREAELYASMTLEVQNIPEYTGDNARPLPELYAKHKEIRAQCTQFLFNRQAFFKAAQSS